MPQQLNLQDLRFVPRPLPCSARQVALGAALFLLTLGVGGQLLRLSAGRDTAQAGDINAKLEPMRQQIGALGRAVAPPPAASGATPPLSPVLASLQSREQAQQRVLQLLRSGIAGQGDGHAETLAALARQANAHVWITGLHVGEDGGQVELRGTMTETARFADYLKRLNAEPRFRGRPFSQLRMSAQAGDAAAAGGQVAVTSGGAPGLTEFTLTSIQRARISTPAAEVPLIGKDAGAAAAAAAGGPTGGAAGAASATPRAGGVALGERVGGTAVAATRPSGHGDAPRSDTGRSGPAPAAIRPTATQVHATGAVATTAPTRTVAGSTDSRGPGRRPAARRDELKETVPAPELQRLQQQALLSRVTRTRGTAAEERRLAQAGTIDARAGEQP